MGGYVFFILSTVAALYTAYLFTCCLYKVDLFDEMDSRVVFPRIVYVIVFCASFIPLINVGCIIAFLIWLAVWYEDYRVKSWLFEKPKQEKKTDAGSVEQYTN